MRIRTTCSLACENGIGDTADAEHYAQREEKEISLFHGDFPFCRSIRLSLLSTIFLHGMRQNKNTTICSFFIGMLLSACSIAHKFRKVNMLFSTIFMYICCILCLKSPQNQKITDAPSRASVIFSVFPIFIYSIICSKHLSVISHAFVIFAISSSSLIIRCFSII